MNKESRNGVRGRPRFGMLGIVCLVISGLSCQTLVSVPEDYIDGRNVPVLVNTLNVVTFAVEANAFSYNRIEPVQFQTDSLVMTLAVSNFGMGTGKITVNGIPDTLLYTENLAGDQVEVRTDMRGCTPKMITIRMDNYTGSVSFVLSKKK